MYAINGNRELPRKLKISTQKHPLSGLSSHRCIETASISSAASTTSYMSSISWVAEKSASEVGSLLKNAYKSLKQKEKGNA
jgi:hypothetical protein